MKDSTGTTEHGGRAGSEAIRSSRLTRLLLLPVFGLYIFVILDSTPPTSQSGRVAAFMLYMIVGMLAVGAIAVRLRALPMMILCLLAAILQTFSMMLMLVIGWQGEQAVVFINVLLILSLLFVAWQFRNDARTGHT